MDAASRRRARRQAFPQERGSCTERRSEERTQARRKRRVTRTTLDAISARRRQRELVTSSAEHSHPRRSPNAPPRAGAFGMVRRTPGPMGTMTKRLKKKRPGEAGGARCRRPGRGAGAELLQSGGWAGAGGRRSRGARGRGGGPCRLPRDTDGAERDEGAWLARRANDEDGTQDVIEPRRGALAAAPLVWRRRVTPDDTTGAARRHTSKLSHAGGGAYGGESGVGASSLLAMSFGLGDDLEDVLCILSRALR
jgi:hypothetical protein